MLLSYGFYFTGRHTKHITRQLSAKARGKYFDALEVKNGVAVIRIDGPGKMNTIDDDFRAELEDLWVVSPRVEESCCHYESPYVHEVLLIQAVCVSSPPLTFALNRTKSQRTPR